jgi:hypothetical protein
MQYCSPEPEFTEPDPKPRAPSRPWTAQEDALLRAAVAKCNSSEICRWLVTDFVRLDGDDTDQWIAIAATLPGRTNKSCRKVTFAEILLLTPAKKSR